MIKNILIFVIGILSLASSSILVKFCSDVPSIMIATYRLVISSIILIGIAKIKGFSLKDVDKRDLLLSILSGFILTIHFISWFASLKLTSVASSVVLVTTNPLFVGIFSVIFLKEKLQKEIVIGIFLSIFGSIVLAVGDSGLSGFSIKDTDALLGDLLALLGAVCASCYLLLGSKVRERLDIMTYITIAYSSSAIFLLAFSIVQGISFTGYSTTSYISMVMLAIFPQMIGHTSVNWSLKHLKPSMVAIGILGEPIGATIMAYFIFNETIDIYKFIGICLIFLSILIASRKGAK
ncbi:MAG: DMT family transporter [Calditerrivibrio sp.]|nr:DMT family transporter [Calditerrivibrio sp.]MCA1932866.1 DMT family transporter [Calditerrivibrio sp.]MCA1979972.1 DMT family transporter [Calditerrivibrio sp.]